LDVIMERQLKSIEQVRLHFMSSRVPTHKQVATLEKNLHTFDGHKLDWEFPSSSGKARQGRHRSIQMRLRAIQRQASLERIALYLIAPANQNFNELMMQSQTATSHERKEPIRLYDGMASLTSPVAQNLVVRLVRRRLLQPTWDFQNTMQNLQDLYTCWSL
jgi:hypothetical protein